jgi:hypothetical protein
VPCRLDGLSLTSPPSACMFLLRHPLFSPDLSPLVLTHLALASDTLTLGLSMSSLSRWLCSVNLLSLSYDMDCLCGRAFMVCYVWARVGLLLRGMGDGLCVLPGERVGR